MKGKSVFVDTANKRYPEGHFTSTEGSSMTIMQRNGVIKSLLCSAHDVVPPHVSSNQTSFLPGNDPSMGEIELDMPG